jgi:hypothetical protein
VFRSQHVHLTPQLHLSAHLAELLDLGPVEFHLNLIHKPVLHLLELVSAPGMEIGLYGLVFLQQCPQSGLLAVGEVQLLREPVNPSVL